MIVWNVIEFGKPKGTQVRGTSIFRALTAARGHGISVHTISGIIAIRREEPDEAQEPSLLQELARTHAQVGALLALRERVLEIKAEFEDEEDDQEPDWLLASIFTEIVRTKHLFKEAR